MTFQQINTTSSTPVPVKKTPTQNKNALTEEEVKLADDITLYISRTFLRRDKRYYRASDTSESYSLDDVQHVLVASLPKVFEGRGVNERVIRAAMKTALNDKHSDPQRKVPIFSGKSVCIPGAYNSVIFDEGFASRNTWISPAYRHLENVEPSTRMLDVFLKRTMPHEQDRELFKNWLAWCLQNEDQKPTWAIILFSNNKGTGKSTLIELVSKLFGEGNTFNCRTVDDVTGRFAAPVFEKKFIAVEEVKLPAGSMKANSMKTYITERKIAVERKGLNMQQIDQSAVFMFTTNHLPTWLEDGERRYMVIGMDHDGHAHGKHHSEFAKFIGLMKNEVFTNDQMIASIYRGLMEHSLPEDFDPFNLPFDKLTSPVMKQLQTASSEVQLDRLREMLQREVIKGISQEDLCKKLRDELNVSENRVKHMMLGLGWSSEAKKWGGVDYKRVIWTAPGVKLHRGSLTDKDGTSYQIGGGATMEPEAIEIIETDGLFDDGVSVEGSDY